MMIQGRENKSRGFTLIELLIVVAIIAILAAIAVPNFLEAQTRSKISRSMADMRSCATALEAYAVDNNGYPEGDAGKGGLNELGVGMIRLTTPVSFITSIPKSPWRETNIGYAGWPAYTPAAMHNANFNNTYLYVGAKFINGVGADTVPTGGDGVNDSYEQDRGNYLAYGVPAVNLAVRAQGKWMLKSVGPDNYDNTDSNQPEGTPKFVATDARIYDPTNGTTSYGDLVMFSDTGFPKK